jgi:hypothetical protein
MQKALTAALLVTLLGATGCMGPWRVRAAQNENQLSYVPKAEDVDVVGPVNAEGENDYLFCLIPTQENGSVNRLVQSMRQSAHADAILNLSIEQRAKWVIFYCWNKVSVSGLAVRFKRYNNVAPQDVSELPLRSPGADKESLKRFFSDLKAGTPLHLILNNGKGFQGTFLYITAALWPSVTVRPADGQLREESFYLGDIWSAEIPTLVPSAGTTTAKDLPKLQVKEGSLEIAAPVSQ